MLKVVLVDDEPIIREGLLLDVPWKEIGMEVVGQAEDGEQALDVLKETSPDIVLTDVRMPFLGGLDFIREAQKEHPHIVYLIISGHDEFSYAQQAVKLGVDEYILKPIEIVDLKESLKRIKTSIEDRKKKIHETLQMKDKLKESLFRDIILKSIGRKDLSPRLEEYSIDTRHQFWIALVISLDGYLSDAAQYTQDQEDQLDWGLYKVLKSSTANIDGAVVVQTGVDECAICASAVNRTKLETVTATLCPNIRGILQEEIQCTATCGIGPVVDNPFELHKSFAKAQQALKLRYVQGGNKEIWYDEKKLEERADNQALNYIDNSLFIEIKLGNTDGVSEKIADLIEDIRNQGDRSKDYMQIMVSSIITEAVKILKDLEIDSSEVIKSTLDSYKEIIDRHTVEEMGISLLEMLHEITSKISSQREGKFAHVIDGVRNYINLHYSENDLSLEQISRAVNMNPVYLSAIFKPESGQTLKEYITGVRMENAKDLLDSSSLRINEICYKVGYNNPTYFSTVFKKKYGKSPADHRGKKN